MKKTDLIIVSITFAIIVFSMLVLFSSCHQKGEFIRTDIFFKQLAWVFIGVVVMFAFSFLDYRRIRDIAWPFYFFALLMLVSVLIIGHVHFGAQRWLRWGAINFQPSEIGKVALVFVLSHYFSQKSFEELIIFKKRSTLLKGFIIPLCMTGLMAYLVAIQPDLGTAIIYFFLFMCLVIFCGVRLRYIVSFFCMIVLVSPVFWFLLRDYQRDRLLVFLNADRDPLGAGYTIIQSKIAIGSGRLFGKGWMSGTQNQLNFLTERHTDFIFSTLGEEWGFVGGVFLLVLFYFLIQRILKISSRVSDPFAKNLCICIAFLFCIQVVINIAMTIGLMPVVGLPLPLVSYGGSSLISFFLLIGIVLNISKRC